MNKLLIITPVILTGAFLAIERPSAHQAEAAAAAHAATLARDEVDAKAKRLAIEAAARADGLRRAADREQQERDKAQAKQRAYAEALHRIEDRTAAITATTTTLAADLAALDRQLAEVRSREEAMTRETFDLTKKVEHQRIERRNAEFEVQRITAMVAQRISGK